MRIRVHQYFIRIYFTCVIARYRSRQTRNVRKANATRRARAREGKKCGKLKTEKRFTIGLIKYSAVPFHGIWHSVKNLIFIDQTSNATGITDKCVWRQPRLMRSNILWTEMSLQLIVSAFPDRLDYTLAHEVDMIYFFSSPSCHSRWKS